MSQTPACPKCGTRLPEDAPAGLCPKCLVQAGLESENPSQPELERTAASPPSSGFEPPAVEELAKRFPQLEILELLGKGGMGAVYKARQPGLDRLVAVKILPTEISHDRAFAERFTREARALARLSHPNIVAVYDFGQTDGLYFFVMEYVDGVNLRQAIHAGGMTPTSALAIVPQICDALQFAHDEGIVHRDIKPENILIDKRGRVKIADFGLAKLLGHELPDHRLTGTHQVMGTLRYMAPEQIEGSHHVDHRADIYSLGVVFYELLTGELPIGRFAPPSKKVQIDVRLDEVVLRALEKEPEQRYQHASELRTSVDHITGTGAGLVGSAPLGRMTDLPPTAPDARLSRCALAGAIWAPFFIATLLIVVVSLGAYFTVRQSVPVRFDPNFPSVKADEPTVFTSVFGSLAIFVAAIIGLIGFAAPFGTTILGVVAIGQIRRSAGNLHGLPLAVFDSLVFPLLLLDGLILSVVMGVTRAALRAGEGRGAKPENISAIVPGVLIFVTGSLFVAWVDYRIARAVWRKVTGYEPPPKPIAAATVPPASNQPAAPVADPHGKPKRVELGFPFLAKTLPLTILGWSLMAILWNAREIGLLICALAVGGVNLFIAQRVENLVAAAAGPACPRNPRIRWTHAVFGILLSAAGVYFLFLGTYQFWDRTNWNDSSLSQDDFRREYQGAEHRLLQRLDRFHTDIPRAELERSSWSSPAGGWNMSTDALPSLDLFMVPFIGCSFVIGAYLFWGGYVRLLGNWPGRCWIALNLTACSLVTAALTYEALSIGLPIYVGKPVTWPWASVTTEQDIRTVLARVDAWATTHRFVRDKDLSWYVKRLPQRDTLAEVELRHLWRESVFDRWHFTWAGRQRAAPDIALEIVGDANGKQTAVLLTARTSDVDDQAYKDIQSQFDSLVAAIKDKTPLPGTKPFELTTIGEGSSSEHLKLDGVFFHVTPEQPALAWATVQAFDQPARPAFLLLVRHNKQFSAGTSFPQQVWTKADEGRVQQTLQVDGMTFEVEYTVHLNPERKVIQNETLKVENKGWGIQQANLTIDGRTFQPAMRLVTIDLAAIPAQVNLVMMKLPPELAEIKTADQLRQRTPEILELLKKEPQAAKFLTGVEPSAKAPAPPPAIPSMPPREARFYALGKLSREAFDRGDSEEAVKLAEEYLVLAASFRKDWNYGNAIHDANALLGLVALERGDVAAAKAYLLAAGKSTGSPQLDSFGPNLELATALLARGEKQTVLEYLAEIGKFWTGGQERLARFAKTIEEGGTPPELKPVASQSPLVGSWLSEEPLGAKAPLHTLLEFSADGSIAQSSIIRVTSKYRVVDAGLMVVNPRTGKDEGPEPLTFKDGKLVLNLPGESRFREKQIELTRVGADDKPGSFVGTWKGKVHIEDVGDAEVSQTFDSNEAGTRTFELRTPRAVRLTYTLKGDKLKYTLNDLHLEAKCQIANDQMTLTGFYAHHDGKPHVFRRLPQSSTAAPPKTPVSTTPSSPKAK